MLKLWRIGKRSRIQYNSSMITRIINPNPIYPMNFFQYGMIIRFFLILRSMRLKSLCRFSLSHFLSTGILRFWDQNYYSCIANFAYNMAKLYRNYVYLLEGLIVLSDVCAYFAQVLSCSSSSLRPPCSAR